jgi:hypothetical protein
MTGNVNLTSKSYVAGMLVRHLAVTSDQFVNDTEEISVHLCVPLCPSV